MSCVDRRNRHLGHNIEAACRILIAEFWRNRVDRPECVNRYSRVV